MTVPHVLLTAADVDPDRGAGPEECWVGGVDGVSQVRCGGDTWGSATPLAPQEGDGA